jgi:hypothetical protein
MAAGGTGLTDIGGASAMAKLRSALRVVPSPMEGEFLKAVMDELDKSKGIQHQEKRKFSRLGYRSLQIVLIIKESGGEVAFMTAARNVSQGGVCLLHRQMLYPAEQCRIVLPLSGNKRLLVRGRVVRCRFIQGVLHEVGVRFDRPIQLAELNEILTMGKDLLNESEKRTGAS